MGERESPSRGDRAGVFAIHSPTTRAGEGSSIGGSPHAYRGDTAFGGVSSGAGAIGGCLMGDGTDSGELVGGGCPSDRGHRVSICFSSLPEAGVSVIGGLRGAVSR